MAFQQLPDPRAINGLTGTTVGNATAFQYTPPSTHLVQGRLQGLMAQRANNRYINQAKDAAVEMALARGQGDTSYASGAATRAAIDAALPIASQDSDTLTKISLANQQAALAQAQIDAMRNQSGLGGGNIIMDMTGEEDAERQHQLQLQRERLAFEGEQGELGRYQQFGMGLMGTEADMFRDYMGFNYGRQNARDQYGYDLGRMGSQFGYNAALARQGSDLDLRSDYFNNRWGMERDSANTRAGAYATALTQGMQIPEFMADPEAFMGFMQFAFGFGWDSTLGPRRG